MKVVTHSKVRSHEIVVIELRLIKEAHGPASGLVSQKNTVSGKGRTLIESHRSEPIHGCVCRRSSSRVRMVDLQVMLFPVRTQVLGAHGTGAKWGNDHVPGPVAVCKSRGTA